jgi:hypothetical protein
MELREMLAALEADPWRQASPYSSDIADATVRLLAADRSAAERLLCEWLAKNQPCLFGRIAARLGLLSFCILTEGDISAGDEHVRQTIQGSRLRWRALAYRGDKSGFVIIVLANRIAAAAPNDRLRQFAVRLVELYLLADVTPDRIYMDEIFLEIEKRDRQTWRWDCGVNFFGTQADGRWWHDHRVPGGVALSVNSVGHMVKSGHLKDLSILEPSFRPHAVTTLAKALELAMRTISLAATTSSGRATELLPVSAEAANRCPVSQTSLPAGLADKNPCEYAGWYHTDITIPSIYFRPDAERPRDASSFRLDFTYLFDDSVANPAFVTMGDGLQIRADSTQTQEHSRKARRLRPTLVHADDYASLREALARYDATS